MFSPDTIRTAIGVVGNGTALVLSLSPVPTFYRIWKNGPVEQYSPIPCIATLLNCMMWVLYGLPVVHPHSMLVTTINGAGMAIELTYVALFLAFSVGAGMAIELTYVALFLAFSVGAARRRFLLLLVAEIAAVFALVLTLAHTHERRSMVVGILCVLFGTGMYAAPLSVMLASHDTQADKGTLLVSHCDHAEDSDPQEVFSQSNTAGSSTEYLVSCEIKPVSLEGDSDSIDANEETHLVIQDSPQCRICFDNEGDDLIAPCHCKGTQKYVHRSCLDKWRSTKEGFAFSHCTECWAAFLLRANLPPGRWWLRLKFQLLVARDHTLIFLIVQLVVVILGMPVYRFYGDELREMFGYEEHPYAFYALAILAIILVGLLYGFFIAIICGQRITERHYDVRANQELTKEYIVEDLEGTDLVPDLDPSHVTELRTLGLY